MGGRNERKTAFAFTCYEKQTFIVIMTGGAIANLNFRKSTSRPKGKTVSIVTNSFHVNIILCESCNIVGYRPSLLFCHGVWERG